MKTFPGKIFLAISIFNLTALQPLQAQSADASATDNSTMQTQLPSDVDPNSPLAQIIGLAQAGVAESVLTSYVSNCQSPFNLSASQIIYLKDIGVPDDVVQAMIQRDQQLGVPANTQSQTTAAAPPPEQVPDNNFYGTLAPYGGWVNIDGYGMCWRPTAVIYNSNWQPYCDHGHWVYSDEGWFWISDYSWGWATFHYGRWFHHSRYGWCWWPDTVWAPSWVCWRYSDNYCGWAPLPPHSEYRAGAGFVYNGITVSAGFDFGISANFFTFVPVQNFCDPHPARFRVDYDRAPQIFRQTTIVNNFTVQNNIIVNHGIDPRHIETVTHTQIRPVAIRESSAPVARGEVLGRDQTLVIHRPQFNGTAISTLRQGIAPRENRIETQRVSNEKAGVPTRPVQQPQNNTQRPAQQNATPTERQNSSLQFHQQTSAVQNSQSRAPVQTPLQNQREIPQNKTEAENPASENRSWQNQNEQPPQQNYDRVNSEDNRRYQSPRAQTQTRNVPQQTQPVQQQPSSGNQQQWQKNKNGD